MSKSTMIIIAEIGVILLVVLAMFQNGLTLIFDIKLRFISFFIVVSLFTLSLISILKSGNHLHNFEKLMLLWMIYGIGSSFFTLQFGSTSSIYYLMAYNYLWHYSWIMIYFGVKYAVTLGVNDRRIISYSLFSGVLLSLFSIPERMYYKYIELLLVAFSTHEYVQENSEHMFSRGWGYEGSVYRCGSFIVEFIQFSYACGLLTVIFLILSFELAKKRYVFGLIICMSGLFLSQSLASIGAVVIISAIYIFLVKRISFKYLSYTFFTLIIISSIYIVSQKANFFGGITTRVINLVQGKDPGYRVHVEEFSYPVINGFSFWGRGIGTADFLHSKIREQIRNAGYGYLEHDYYRTLSETGGIGFTLHILLLFFLFKYLYSRYQSTGIGTTRIYLLISICFLLFYLIVGFFHRSFPMYAPSTLFSIVLGCALGRVSIHSRTVT